MPELRILRSVALPERRIVFRRGEFVAPIGIGPDADAIEAQSLAAVPQCSVYFDGETLFVASRDPAHPVITAGRSLGTGWVPIGCPSILQLERGSLVYEPEIPFTESTAERVWFASGELSATRAGGPPVPIPEVLQAGAPPHALVPAADLRKRLLFDPQKLGLEHAVEARVTRFHSARTEPPAEQVGSGRARARGRIGAHIREEFRKTSKGVRLTLLALPIVAWGALGADAADQAPQKAAPRVEARKPEASYPARARGPAPHARPTSAQRGASTVGTAAAGKRTLESQAAEALARGDAARAAVLYDELAAAAPERAEFASAARILRRNSEPIERNQ